MTLSPVPGLFADENSELQLPQQASQTYREVMAVGPPAQPLDFPTPVVHKAAFVSALALDHRQGRVYDVNILCRTSANVSKVGYLIKKKIARSTYGSVQLCIVLRRRHNLELGGSQESEWISTDDMVAVKCSSWAKIRKNRGRHLEDPLKEAACLQLVGNYHSNILGCLEVLQDDDYLYTVMPYCSGGDLCSFIRKSSLRKRRAASNSPTSEKTIATARSNDKSVDTTISSTTIISAADEVQARSWFRQLLEGLHHLQKKGVCHRDLSISNILLEGNNNLVIVDFGLALRVPYKDNSNVGGVADVSEGSDRLLMVAQGQSGSLAYLAPEIIERDQAFDGFAADLWSAGVLLFVFLVGLAPFQVPSATDFRYMQINKGMLKELMAANLEEPVSDEACDLLQNMLWRDPRKRLTLAQVLQHPWVVGPPSVAPTLPPLQPQAENISPRRELSSVKNFPAKPVTTRLASF